VSTKEYNPFPLVDWHKQWPRQELHVLRKKYGFSDDREACALFEEKLGDFTGAEYCVLTASCTDALFLVFEEWKRQDIPYVEVPSRTYISVPMALIHAGYKIKFVDRSWKGEYKLEPFNIWDSAMRFCPGYWENDRAVSCLSFQMKKRLPIGKGGAILLRNEHVYNRLRKKAFEGRDAAVPYDKDMVELMGYNMYMSPDDAARGCLILDDIIAKGGPWDDVGGSDNYPSLKNLPVFQNNPMVIK